MENDSDENSIHFEFEQDADEAHASIPMDESRAEPQFAASWNMITKMVRGDDDSLHVEGKRPNINL